MRIKLYILLSVLLLSAVGCSRKAVTQKSHTSLHQDSSNTAIDTTHTSFTETNEETINYGDTLNGDIPLIVDGEISKEGYSSTGTLESNGIKVKVALTPVKGGFKANVNAIAKPKSITNNTTKTGTEAKGISNANSNKKDLQQENKNKQTETDSVIDNIFLNISIALFLVIAGILFYIQKRRNANI